ncbi:MAG TPA: DUF5011 domain-containing protein [Chitinophagaceae bacterium]|jgi:hypothetical protein|nr:DUF5011 domain-containing protein [Chitinophagaceae bacterium]
MSKISQFLIALCLLVFAGCEKADEINNTEDRIGHSRVTRFPVFTMEGDEFISIVKGGTYTEPGVTAAEGASALTVTTTGTVDASTPGVYELTYSATNKDGFAASVTRTVAVLPEAEQAGVNIAGNYANTGSFSYVAVMKKLAPGFYVADNVWGGGSAAIIPAYILTTDGKNLLVPESYLSPYGGVEGTGTLDAEGNLTYVISLLDQGVSNSTRKWKRQ